MSPILCTIRAGTTLAAGDAGGLVVTAPRATLTLKQVTPALHAALDRLFTGGAAMDDLRAAVMDADGTDGLYKLTHYLKTLSAAGLICYAVDGERGRIATLEPIAERFRFDPAAVDPATRYQLSRFAWLRRDGDRLLLESPLGHAQVALGPVGAAVAARLTTPAKAADLTGGPLSAEIASAVLTLLSNAGALDAEADTSEDQRADLRQWEFHDLLFHARSRLGRHDHPYGGTRRFVNTLPPAPGVKPPMSTRVVALPTPDLDAIVKHDRPFGAVLEARRSIRDMADAPLSLAQLGEFLYRSARVRKLWHTDAGDVSQRPYPGGGALHELEIYPIVDRCDGLDTGVYHYDPLHHGLEHVAARDERVERLLATAWQAADRRSKPQIVLVITARFARLQRKYESMVYAAVLKHVGVLFQTFYLAATAMDLAPCALGGGDSDLFGEIAGLDYTVESAVGEFILGTRGEHTGSRFDAFEDAR